MKRLILAVLVIGVLLLSACGASATAPSSEAPLTPSPTEQPTPATFIINDLYISPTEIDTGEEITITVHVSNMGDEAGGCVILFAIEGEPLHTEDVALGGGYSTRIDLSSEVNYAAGTYTVNVDGLQGNFDGNGLSGTFIIREEPPSATFTITSFDQTYYEGLGKWSDYVYIYYDVENNGTVHLRYYEVYFTITCEDGSQYREWTNGSHILVGQRWSDWTIKDIEGKKVTSVEIADWELQAGGPPEVMYEITGTAEEVFVTLGNAEGGTEQYDDVRVPKKYSYSSFPGSFLYISAQNQGEYGTVRVSIYVNGERFKTSSSSGAYVIATASGSK